MLVSGPVVPSAALKRAVLILYPSPLSQPGSDTSPRPSYHESLGPWRLVSRPVVISAALKRAVLILYPSPLSQPGSDASPRPSYHGSLGPHSLSTHFNSEDGGSSSYETSATLLVSARYKDLRANTAK
jgi:hypothetical protein